jgi:hypothetical protein
MKKAAETESETVGGIGALFDDYERKELFRKYLFFLGWIEILIFVICWFYQMGDGGYGANGPVDIPFPWKTYFAVAFLAPVATTFIIGVIIVGFNKYFVGETKVARETHDASGAEEPVDCDSGRLAKIQGTITWLQKLPFLALLLLLGIGVGFFYKLDAITSFLGVVGEKSFKFFIISAAVLVGLASIFGLILIIFNYQLRKKSMDYQYRSEVAERYGLIILDDNTVLNSEGQLLVNGKQLKDTVPLLPRPLSEKSSEMTVSSLTTSSNHNIQSGRVDLKAT